MCGPSTRGRLLATGIQIRSWGLVELGAEAIDAVKDAARALPWGGPDDPGGWSPVQRRFRDGHTGTWWATDASLGWWGPDGQTRLVVATTDPDTLPDKATWYLATNLPRPGGLHDIPDVRHVAADLTEVVRLYGIRHWIEQGYKQVKDELGWADFQVRSATAIRRHQTLVNCAFSLCWKTWFDQPSTSDSSAEPPPPEPPTDDSGEREQPNRPATPTTKLAQSTPRLAHTRPHQLNCNTYSTRSHTITASTCTYHPKVHKLPLG
jgi:hypothetical protein